MPTQVAIFSLLLDTCKQDARQHSPCTNVLCRPYFCTEYQNYAINFANKHAMKYNGFKTSMMIVLAHRLILATLRLCIMLPLF